MRNGASACPIKGQGESITPSTSRRQEAEAAGHRHDRYLRNPSGDQRRTRGVEPVESEEGYFLGPEPEGSPPACYRDPAGAPGNVRRLGQVTQSSMPGDNWGTASWGLAGPARAATRACAGAVCPRVRPGMVGRGAPKNRPAALTCMSSRGWREEWGRPPAGGNSGPPDSRTWRPSAGVPRRRPVGRLQRNVHVAVGAEEQRHLGKGGPQRGARGRCRPAVPRRSWPESGVRWRPGHKARLTLAGLGAPATVSGSTLAITGAGTVKVTASQAGNSSYAAATPVLSGELHRGPGQR